MRAVSGELSGERARELVRVARVLAPGSCSQLHLQNALFGRRNPTNAELQTERGRYWAAHNALLKNEFGRAAGLIRPGDRRAAQLAWYLSLGNMGSPPPQNEDPNDAVPGSPTFALQAFRSHKFAAAFKDARPLWRLAAAADAAVARALSGVAGSDVDRHSLRCALRVEGSWSSRVVLGLAASKLQLTANRPHYSLRVLAEVRDGYARLRAKSRNGTLLRSYVEACRTTLGAFEPPIRPGKDPVRTVAMVARRLKKRKRVRAHRTIRALDAIITVGRKAPTEVIERRVVRELARMMHARVLLHYSRGQYHELEPQSRHTLSTWTIRKLVRERRFVGRRIKRRPEFWRPEQRRPRGLLSFPIGDGTACLARGRTFERKDAQAVRSVLRFLRARLEHESRNLALPEKVDRGAPKPVVPGIVGESRPWRRMLDNIWKLAPSSCPVFIQGETGSGKELTARALHYASRRSHGPFVVVNCGAFASGTLLSELFGHVRGAFSGAYRNRQGIFEQAHQGTLFLDELAEMPYEMQVALLRVLEEKVIRPVGSGRTRKVNVRVVSATNQDLRAAIDNADFREDLYHRLCNVSVRVPPLRERMDDLPALAQHFLFRHDPSKQLHVDSMALLNAYEWPGNVRELDNVLQAASLLSDGTEVEPGLLQRILHERRKRHPTPPSTSTDRLPPRAATLLERMGRRWWSCREIAGASEISVRTANRDLAALCDQGLVEAMGETRRRRYRRAT